MERLWTAAGTATLVIAAIALNALRYPAVSDMIGPSAAPVATAETPAPASPPSPPPPAWTNEFAPAAPPSPPPFKAPDPPSAVPAAPLPPRDAAFPSETAPDPASGALSWPAASGAPPRAIRGVPADPPPSAAPVSMTGTTPRITGFRADPPQPESWGPAPKVDELVPIKRHQSAATSAPPSDEIRRLPPVDAVGLPTDGPLPSYPAAGK